MIDRIFRKKSQSKDVFQIGEKVREIITEEDSLGYGLAIAEIDSSEKHYHKNTTETYYVLDGLGRIELVNESESETIEMRKGDTLVIKPGTMHYGYVINQSDGKRKFNVLVHSTPAWSLDDHYYIGSNVNRTGLSNDYLKYRYDFLRNELNKRCQERDQKCRIDEDVCGLYQFKKGIGPLCEFSDPKVYPASKIKKIWNHINDPKAIKKEKAKREQSKIIEF